MSQTSIQETTQAQEAVRHFQYDPIRTQKAVAAKKVASPGAKDSIVASLKQESHEYESASLPSLTPPWQTFTGVGEKGSVSLIAIIAFVSILQMQSTHRFYSAMFKESNESMMMQVKFAPIIGASIINAANAEANVLYSQASQQESDAKTSLFSFGGAVLGGAFMEAKDPQAGGVDDDQTDFEEEGTTKAPGEVEGEARENAQADMKKINEAIENDKSWGDRAVKSGKWLLDRGGAIKNRLVPWLQKSMMLSQMGQQFSQGVNGWFIDAPALREQGYQKGVEGQAQALSKMSEQYSQVFSEIYTREDSLRENSQQAFDQFANSWRTMADRITDTSINLYSKI